MPKKREIKSFTEAFKHLRSLEEFPIDAFIDGDRKKKAVCNFVLTLALAYNDSKDLNLILALLGESKPSGKFVVRPDWGEYVGIGLHITRLQVSLLHELMEFIENQKNVLEDELFKEIVRCMEKKQTQSLARNCGCGFEKRATQGYFILDKNKINISLRRQGGV